MPVGEEVSKAIQVRAFEGEPQDDELLLLSRYLETLIDVPNVRAVEKRGWRSRIQNS